MPSPSLTSSVTPIGDINPQSLIWVGGGKGGGETRKGDKYARDRGGEEVEHYSSVWET